MNKFLLGAILVLIVTTAQAQEAINNNSNAKITGRIIDSSSHSPIEYATISLFAAGTNKTINGTTSDVSGKFTITNVTPGTYKIVAEFIGYEAVTLNNVVLSKSNQTLNIKDIVLLSKANTLQNVTVTSTGRLIENKIDKLVFNAEKDLTSQTGVATDILKKVPQVTVGIDGNVELSGSSSIRFLINGKPSSAFGSNITDVLASIPANQIKSIEVITNPGAKYDAQGLGGIINIILKKNNAQGINGNLSLTGGTRTENGSFNFNARKGTFGVNAFISGNTRLTANTPSYSNRTTNDTAANTNILLHQDGASEVSRNGFQTGMGFDWTYKEKNSFSGSVAYNHFGYNGNGYTNQFQNTMDKVNGTSLSNILSLNNINNAFRFHNIDASLNYRRTFSKEDQELEIALNSSNGNSVNTAANNQYYMPQDALFYSTNSRNPGGQKENELKVDYAQPLAKDIILGVGGKINFRDITSTSDVLKLKGATNSYENDPFLTNNLDYHQKVYALYSEISLPVAKLFDVKFGERYERTEINAFYSNAQTQKAIPGYNTFVPSIYFSRKLDDESSIKLSYSKRIERPDYGDLNPFINTSDPKNISTGNSNLQPEIGHRYELAYNRDLGKAGSFMINLFYRKNENDIQPFVVYYPTYTVGDSTYSNVAVSTRMNIGTEKNIGVNLFADVRPVTKMSIRTNLFFFHRDIINAVDKGYNISSFNYRFNLNTSYQFSNTLAGEFFGNFQSARNEAQGKYPSFTTYSFAVRKQFWNKNGSLALTATNPFKDAVDQNTSIFGPNFVVNSERSIPFRSFGINFTWKFGHLEFKKDKPEEDKTSAPVEN